MANNLLRWVRDYAQVKSDGFITKAIADKALEMLDIDRDGLDEMDKRLLEALVVRFQGGPVGLSSLAVSVGEDSGTVEEVNEPYLIQEGFIKRTAQGRVAMPKAYEKMGVPIPPNRQGELGKGEVAEGEEVTEGDDLPQRHREHGVSERFGKGFSSVIVTVPPYPVRDRSRDEFGSAIRTLFPKLRVLCVSVVNHPPP